MKVDDYRTVSVQNKHWQFDEEVKALLSEGWELHGIQSTANCGNSGEIILYQTLVKPTAKEIKDGDN